MRILLDIDGVYAEFCAAFCSVAASIGYEGEIITTFTQPEWAFPFETSPVWNEMKRRWNWWTTLEPIVDEVDIDATNRLIKDHDVYFITSRPRTKGVSVERQVELWLDGIGIDANHAIVIATKTGTKGVLADALDIDIALDDYIENLKDLWLHEVDAIGIRRRYNEPWNGAFVDTVAEFAERYC